MNRICTLSILLWAGLAIAQTPETNKEIEDVVKYANTITIEDLKTKQKSPEILFRSK